MLHLVYDSNFQYVITSGAPPKVRPALSWWTDLDKQSRLVQYRGAADPYSTTSLSDDDQYGPLKALCEQEAAMQLPGRSLIVRPGEHIGSLTFWVVRMEKVGEILAAGDPLSRVQISMCAIWRGG